MTERETFLHNIRHPDNVLDDTVRLAYADYLDGLDSVRVVCPKCKRPDDAVNHVTGHIFVGWGHGWQPCTHCDGTGTVRDESAADLAELIRVQIRLTNPPWNSTDMIRERELLDAHPEWLRTITMPCPGCGGCGMRKDSADDCSTCGGTGDLLRYFPGEGEVAAHGEPVEGSNSRNPNPTRGLTLSVACRLGEVVREVPFTIETCSRCKGNGQVKVNSYHSWEIEECPTCHGNKTIEIPKPSWQPAPWALAFWAACVGTGRVPWFVVTDRTPVNRLGKGVWQSESVFRSAWDGGPNPHVEGRYDIPDSVFTLLPNRNAEFGENMDCYRVFPTPDAARHILEFVLYRFCYKYLTAHEAS